MLQQGTAAAAAATKVVCLTQVVTEDELRNDEEYEDIVVDMRDEGGKFGKNSPSLKATFTSVLVWCTIVLVSVFKIRLKKY